MLLVSGEADTLCAAPITLNTAMPVAEGEFLFREQFIVDRSADTLGGVARDRDVFVSESLLGYGVNRDLALFAILPYVDKSLDRVQGGVRSSRSAADIGDLTLFARYTVFRKDWRGRTLRLAPFVGVQVPTGKDNETDGLGRLPGALQPGSGSADALAGMVLTYSTLDFQVDAQTSYKANTQANNFEFGDVFRLDASLQYRLWPRSLKGLRGRIPAFVYGVLESNFIHSDNNAVGGAEDPNSGGSSWFLFPGLQYVTERWVVEGGVQVPVIQDLNGTGLARDYIVRAGFRFNF